MNVVYDPSFLCRGSFFCVEDGWVRSWILTFFAVCNYCTVRVHGACCVSSDGKEEEQRYVSFHGVTLVTLLL